MDVGQFVRQLGLKDVWDKVWNIFLKKTVSDREMVWDNLKTVWMKAVTDRDTTNVYMYMKYIGTFW